MGMAAILVMWPKPFEHTFVRSSQVLTWNLASVGSAIIEENKFENIKSWVTWTKVSEWPWPLVLIKLHVLS